MPVPVETKKGKIGERYEKEHVERKSLLDSARRCAELTKPWVLPNEAQGPDDELPENFQSVGSRGVTNIVGKSLTALFSPHWFQHTLAAEIKYDRLVPDEVKQDIASELYMRDLVMQGVLMSAHNRSKEGDNRAPTSTFLTRKRAALDQLFVTGDVLEHLTNDYRLVVFRRDQYITKRDSEALVCYHTIKERKDPMGLAEDMQAKAQLSPETMTAESAAERMTDMYTHVEWNPKSQVWVIQQELNGEVINEFEETVTPYFASTFELSPGENYGRGLVELNKGDLRSLDELELRRLDLLGVAAKQLWVTDYNSRVRERDLMKPSGSFIKGRVEGGRVQDVALLGTAQISEFQILTQGITDKSKALGEAFLTESDVQPRGDRVTAFQVQRIALELDSALGGVYTSISDEQQLPLLARVTFQMEKERLIASMGEDIRIEALTGFAALTREREATSAMTLVQVLAQLGPQAIQRINEDVLINLLTRGLGISEPGLVKSAEQIAQEQAAAAQQQLAASVNQKAVDTVGNMVESAAAEAPPEEIVGAA